ncbi:MAG TPA: PfkB family carbohydrate kinase [Acidobacteriota bacterium]|nr:PfkB family carbohydrate kinase [Acidobacteriota bacterium]
MSPVVRPVVFGEVLFDVFPGGQRVLGGAPFNVAWHLKGFGFDPLFLSRIGMDPEGDLILEKMSCWGMNVSGVQRDPLHPTGRVEVAIRDGEPSFTISPDQAYDFVEFHSIRRLLKNINASVLYNGTLALRHTTSEQALICIQDLLQATVFVDFNLRAPWWTNEIVEKQLKRARWAKMNESELHLISEERVSGKDSIERACRLRERYELDGLIVTMGTNGARIHLSDGQTYSKKPESIEIEDTVGAGDAFSAVFLAGQIHGWPPEVSLERAIEFASAVCGIRGAVAEDPAFYSPFRERWFSDT